jgi:uncharacterized repeat protein (TIGR01451 family)
MRSHRLSDQIAGDPDDSLVAQRSTMARKVLAAGRAAVVATVLLFGATPVVAGIFGVPTNLNADGTLSGASVNPPGFFILTTYTNTATTSGDSVHQMKFFIEVTGATLDIKVFDAGSNSSRDFGGTVNTTYALYSPAGAALATIAIGNDNATTGNRLARFSCTGGAFTAANAGTYFGQAGCGTTISPGLYEFRVTVTNNNGNRYNAFGIDIRDGATTNHYNVFTYGSSDNNNGAPGATETSLIAGAMNQDTAPFANITQPMVFYPYVNRGCSVQTTNFDMDSGGADAGTLIQNGSGSSATLTDVSGTATALTMSGDQASAQDPILVASTTVTRLASFNYGMYALTNAPGTQQNVVDWRLADWQGGASLGAGLPFQPTSALRTYLPNGYGTAPAEPVVTTSTRVVSGVNPPAAGSTTRFLISATVSNPLTSPGPLSNLQITIPLVTGATFVAGTEECYINAAPVSPCTRTGTTYARYAFAAAVPVGQVATFNIQVDYALPNNTAVKNVTGPPATAPTRAITSITRAGQTATVTSAAHGYTTGDFVTIQGAAQPEYNGLFQITVTNANTFTYQVGGSPATPATGTITAIEACPKTADGPVCAAYTAPFSSTGASGFPRSEALGPACQLIASIPVDLAITKTAAPATVVPGPGTITYTLVATNNGPNPLGNVVVTDPLPAGTTFQSVAAPAGWSCESPAVGAGGTVSCVNSGTLPSAGSATITIGVAVSASVSTNISNTATVSGPGTETAPGNNSATATTAVTVQADLSVSKSTQTLYTAAAKATTITYSLLVLNTGPSDAPSATLSDPIPTGMTFQALASPAGWSCTTPAIGGTGVITCSLTASLPAGSSSAFTLLLNYTGSGAVGASLVNQATVASTTDPNASNNTASATTILTGAAVCATPGKDGNLTVTGPLTVNTYYPGTATAPTGSTSITLGTATGATNPLAVGDLVLVMQMQDAAIDSNNDERYGDGTGTAGNTTGNASGWTNLNNSGRYEYAKVIGGVPVGGGVVQIQGLGAGGGLLFTYTNAAASGTQGQRQFQVVRVPQYNNVGYGAGGTLTSGFWNGTTGGVLALDVAGTLTLATEAARTATLAIAAGGLVTATSAAHGFAVNDLVTIAGASPGAYNGTFTVTTVTANTFTYQLYRTPGNATPFPTTPASGTITATRHAVNVTGRGFRGGAGPQYTGGTGTATDYRFPAGVPPNGDHGSKGEGAAGTPRYVLDPSNFTAVVDTGIDGYPNGSNGRGAPANAGGGGTDTDPAANQRNTGGGGGGNGGIGGQGGNSWNDNLPRGGFGGAAFVPAPDRVALGGGGGGGSRNNTPGLASASAGGAGGGLVMIRANLVAGTGTIVSDGAQGIASDNDGGGGGGAGGTVVVSALGSGLSGISVLARGGIGGSAWPTDAGGPADQHGPGGGGAGGVVISWPSVGAADVSGGVNGTTLTAATAYGATSGTGGQSLSLSSSQLPGVSSGGLCSLSGASADVGIVKTAGTSPVQQGQVITYSLLVQNYGPATATNVTATDSLPGGVSFQSAATTRGACTYGAPTLTCNLGAMLVGDFATITISATATGTGLVNNTASVTRTEADPNPANNSSTAPVTILAAADPAVTISGTPDPVNPGRDIAYSISVTNNGPGTATGAQLTFPLPPNTTLLSFTPPAGWTCSAPAVGAAGTITCTNPTLLPSASATFDVGALVDYGTPSGTVISASASISSTSTDTNAANNSASTTTAVNAGVLLLTRATIRGLRVDPSGVVEFVTGTQKNTRSFNLYATDDRSYDGGKTLLNATPVLSPRPDSMMAILYRVETSPINHRYILIEETETTGKVFTYGPYSVVNRPLRRGLEAVEAQLDRFGVPAGPVRVSRVAFDTREEMHARTRALVVRARRAAERATRSASRSERGERDSSRSDALRIEVAGSGETVIPVSTLATEGMPDVPWRKLRLTSGGRSVSFERAMRAGVDSLVFRAETLTTDFTDENVYVLSWGSTPPAPSVQLTSSSDPLRPGVTRVERDSIYNATFIGDRWLWDLLIGDGTTWPYPEWDPTAGRFDLPRLAAAGSGLVPVKIKLVGASDTSHQVSARINGVDVGSLTFAGLAPGVIEGSVPLGSLRASGNELSLTYSARNGDGTPSDSGYVYLDYVDLGAPMIPPASTALVTDIRAYEPDLPSFGGVRYLIVTHPLFRAQADRLAALKTAEGLKAVVVETETAYDRFSSGVEDPQAIAALIRYAAAASSRLTYAVLFGDDTLDPRNHLGGGGIAYVPSILGPDAYSLVPNENAYADVDNDGRPDIALGRLPVTTIEEATDVVDKIENQAATLLASRNVHLFVSDAPGAAGADFAQQAEEMAALLPEASTTVFADAGAGVGPARATLFGSWQQGVTATHYFGHGGPEIWTDHALFSVDDVPALLDHMPPSMLFMWACQSQYFQYYYAPSLGEALFLLPRSGTVSSFGPVGITSTLGQRAIYTNVYKNLYKRGVSIGEMIRQAKLAALDESARNQDVVNSFMLFGDPSLTLDPSPRRPRP